MSGHDIILTALKIFAVLALVLMNGLFVAAELAMVRVRDSQLATLAAKGNRRAKTARHILKHIDAYIGATQFGITLASLCLGIAVEPVFRDLLEPIYKLAGITSEPLRQHIALGVGFLRQLLFAHRRGRTGTKGGGHPPHPAGVFDDGGSAGLVLSSYRFRSSGC